MGNVRMTKVNVTANSIPTPFDSEVNLACDDNSCLVKCARTSPKMMPVFVMIITKNGAYTARVRLMIAQN